MWVQYVHLPNSEYDKEVNSLISFLKFKPAKIKRSTIFSCILYLVIGSFIAGFGISYFSEPVFYLNTVKYKRVGIEQNRILYESNHMPPVQVAIGTLDRTVILSGEEYIITPLEPGHLDEFKITYPSGSMYTVKGQNGMLLSYNENGEMLPLSSSYMNGKKVLSPGEELYAPDSLIRAAYAEFHAPQGYPENYWIAAALLAVSWFTFKHEQFQKLLYWLTPRRDREYDFGPTDFDLLMFKIAGVIGMIGAFIFFIGSL